MILGTFNIRSMPSSRLYSTMKHQCESFVPFLYVCFPIWDWPKGTPAASDYISLTSSRPTSHLGILGYSTAFHCVSQRTRYLRNMQKLGAFPKARVHSFGPSILTSFTVNASSCLPRYDDSHESLCHAKSRLVSSSFSIESLELKLPRSCGRGIARAVKDGTLWIQLRMLS